MRGGSRCGFVRGSPPSLVAWQLPAAGGGSRGAVAERSRVPACPLHARLRVALLSDPQRGVGTGNRGTVGGGVTGNAAQIRTAPIAARGRGQRWRGAVIINALLFLLTSRELPRLCPPDAPPFAAVGWGGSFGGGHSPRAPLRAPTGGRKARTEAENPTSPPPCSTGLTAPLPPLLPPKPPHEHFGGAGGAAWRVGSLLVATGRAPSSPPRAAPGRGGELEPRGPAPPSSPHRSNAASSGLGATAAAMLGNATHTGTETHRAKAAPTGTEQPPSREAAERQPTRGAPGLAGRRPQQHRARSGRLCGQMRGAREAPCLRRAGQQEARSARSGRGGSASPNPCTASRVESLQLRPGVQPCQKSSREALREAQLLSQPQE